MTDEKKKKCKELLEQIRLNAIFEYAFVIVAELLKELVDEIDKLEQEFEKLHEDDKGEMQ